MKDWRAVGKMKKVATSFQNAMVRDDHRIVTKLSSQTGSKGLPFFQGGLRLH